jgi:hypothetical protein
MSNNRIIIQNIHSLKRLNGDFSKFFFYQNHFAIRTINHEIIFLKENS